MLLAAFGGEARGAVGDSGRLVSARAELRRGNIGRESRFVLKGATQRLLVEGVPAGIVDLGFGVAPSAWENGLEEAAFTVTWSAGEKRRVLLRRRLRAGDGARWVDERLLLPVEPGVRGAIELAAAVVSGRADPDSLYWALPRLETATPAAGPNLILFSIDTLRADHLGCYGYDRETSPHIDALAGAGVLFRNAIAPSSWTLPSHASMFTGLRPSVHGAVEFSGTNPLPRSLETLPERLWDRGYETVAFTGGGFLSAAMGFDQGFDRYCYDERSREALAWIKRRRGGPFFLFLHTYAVHTPYTPRPPYDTLFDPGYAGRFQKRFSTLAARRAQTTPGGALDARELEHVQALYDGEIRGVDDFVGRLMTTLEKTGLADDTCVVITSDHGEEFREHGNLFHGRAKLFHELLRVPLIFWCPSRYPGGRVIDAPVSIMDVTPTLLEVAAAAPLGARDGTSLVPWLRDLPVPVREDTLSEVDRSVEGGRGRVSALRTNRYKLIEKEPEGSYQLFDLRRDPGEKTDIGRRQPRVLRRMIKEKRARERRPTRSSPASAEAAPESPPPTLDASTLERLHALGYRP